MKIKNYVKGIYEKYIGNIEYVVTTINVDASIKYFTFKNKREIDDFINEINCERYWFVYKIEKKRVLKYSYDKEVIHTPLWFTNDITENHIYDNHEYSFLKKHDSLTNISRCERKEKSC